MSVRFGRAARAGVGYSIGNLMIKAVAFLTIPLFTRMMSTADYGLYGAYASYEAMASIVIGLGLHASFKSANQEFAGRIDEYASCSVLISGIAAAGFLLCASFVYPWFSGAPAWLLSVHALGTALVLLYNARLALEYRFAEYLALAATMTAVAYGSSVYLIRFVYPDAAYLGRIGGSALAATLAGGYAAIRLFHAARPRLSRAFVGFGLRYGLPIVPHGLSQTLLSQFDRIMIQRMVGSVEAGLYGFAWNFGLIMQVLAASIAEAWSPWFFERMREQDYASIRSRSAQLLWLFAFLSAGLIILSPRLVRWIAPEAYWASSALIGVVVMDVFSYFLYLMPAQLEYYMKKTRNIMWGTLVSAGLNVVLNGLAIPRFGYIAAAYTTLLCYAVNFGIHMTVARRYARDAHIFPGWAMAVSAALVGIVAVLMR